MDNQSITKICNISRFQRKETLKWNGVLIKRLHGETYFAI